MGEASLPGTIGDGSYYDRIAADRSCSKSPNALPSDGVSFASGITGSTTMG
jgi:hypothetical protein